MNITRGILLPAGLLFLLPVLVTAQTAPPDHPAIQAFDQAVAAQPSIAKNIDLTLDVIGFDIRKGSSEEKQLSETAAAGVGKYYAVAKPQDLAAIFTQVTTGIAAGGGGGMVMPSSGGISPMVLGLIGLGLGIMALGVGILAVRRRRAAPAAGRTRPARAPGGRRVSGRLDVFYEDGGTKSVALAGPVTTIGRAGDNDVPLHDSLVSGRHAEILAGADGFMLRDLGSANGTVLNGRPVTESPLYLGDEIIVGATRIVLGE